MAYNKIVFEDESLDVVNTEFDSWRVENPNAQIVSDTTTKNSIYKRTVVYNV